VSISKLKVMTVVGTRPEIIRLSRVITVLDRETNHVLVHTGQNYDYELNEIFFKDLELRKPDHFLEAAGATAAETVGNVIAAADRVLEKEKPEALLILGDTNSCLVAYPAKRRKIPVFHMEAGNRCFDQRVPEEINRKIVDHISDINLPYSSIAREYLLREGIPPDRVIKTGSPMFEVLHYNMAKIEASKVLQELELEPRGYYVVSAHREENIEPDDHFNKLLEILRCVASEFNRPIIVSTHPRTRKRLERAKAALPSQVRFLKPFGFVDYIKLQKNAAAVLSDSGTITEESSILNFPALNIREAHERPEGMEEGSVMMTGLNVSTVLRGLAILPRQARGEERTLRVVEDYTMPNVSEKVVRVILSYTDYIRMNVWKEKL
jgi:UDP-N-acetyl-L-fucosamine synthase